MGKDLETMVSVNDGGWHHVAVTWSSTNGAYAAYQDGIKMAFGVNFQTGQVVINISIPSNANRFSSTNYVDKIEEKG